MRDPRAEHAATREAVDEATKAARARAATAALAVLKTDDGRELFGYLAKKFHLRGRSFLTTGVNAGSCPYAAAVRDGEKAAIMHVFDLARLLDEQIPIP